jgi:UDP-N-acetyl-2-amino-2-deoxyglucuronate dehydrogenase
MTRPRMGVVGLGMALKPHAQSYADLADRLELALAWSPSQARRKAAAAEYGLPMADSLDQILGDGTISMVSILTPPNTHLELVEACAAAGKHVLLEKPLDVSSDRARALVAACDRAGVTLGVVLQHRFRAPGERLGALLREGALGRIVAASVAVPNWRPQSYYDQPGRGTMARDGGGVLITQAIHTLDLFISLVGLPQEVFAYATTTPVHRMETEDLVTGSLRFADGALGSVLATTTAYPGLPEIITVIGEKATASIAGTSLSLHYHDGRTEEFADEASQGGTGADPMAFPNDFHRALIVDFLDAVEHRRPPRISGHEALKVHRLIDGLLESAETGGTVVL